MTSKEYVELKEKVEYMRKRHDQSVGALKEIEKTMKEEFGCTLEDSPKVLEKLEKELAGLEKAFGKELHAFNEKWKDRLEDE